MPKPKEVTVATLNPMGDRLMVRPVETATERTKGGLYVPKTAQEKTQLAEVLAVGTGRVTDQGVTVPLPFTKGQYILHGKFAGQEIVVGHEAVLMLRESDVIATVR